MLKLLEHIQLKAGPKEGELKDSEKFVSFFPTFVWAVRDFTLELEVDGKEISEDEYLENALKLKAGEGMVLCCWRGPAPSLNSISLLFHKSPSPVNLFHVLLPCREQPRDRTLQPAPGMYPPVLPGPQVLCFSATGQLEGAGPFGGSSG